jgi:tetratricopeptide (TPR) repeat protein
MRSRNAILKCGGLTPLLIANVGRASDSARAFKIQNGVKPRHSKVSFLLAGLGICFACAALAHDSPEHKVQQISSELARSGKSPALLMERGYEHRALAQLAHAAADFEAAYRLDPELIVALKELALVQLTQNETEKALGTINSAIAKSGSSDFLVTRAEIYAARKDYRAALQDCEAAFRETSNNLEWYLLRAQLQRRLGLFQQCLKDLQTGFAETGSAVLQEEIIEAQIDAGQHKAALQQIERELADSRWRSSWLIRRARARIGLGETTAGEHDLRAALKELNRRIIPEAPEVSLIIDRGLAHALLKDHKAATRDFERARSLSGDPAILWRLEQLRNPPTR